MKPTCILRIGAASVVLGLGFAVSLTSTVAHANPYTELAVDDGRIGNGLVAEYAWVAYLTARYQHSGHGVGLAYQLSLPRGFELEAGMRGLWGPRVAGAVAMEAFVGAALAPDFGVWRPRLGVESGYSWLVTDERPPDVVEPPGIDPDYRASVSPVYAAIVAAPLRLHVWEFDVAAFEFAVGTTIPDVGRAFRLTIILGRVTWSI